MIAESDPSLSINSAPPVNKNHYMKSTGSSKPTNLLIVRIRQFYQPQQYRDLSQLSSPSLPRPRVTATNSVKSTSGWSTSDMTHLVKLVDRRRNGADLFLRYTANFEDTIENLSVIDLRRGWARLLGVGGGRRSYLNGKFSDL
jgi:hypothetical protein